MHNSSSSTPRIWRAVAVGGALGVIACCGIKLLTVNSVALSLLLALMAAGTLVAKLPQAPRIAIGAGVVATIQAGLALFGGQTGPAALSVLFGIAAGALLLGGLGLARVAHG